MKKTNLLARLVAVSAILFSTLSFAGNDSEIDANGVILAGHDAVAYFTENAAVEGRAKFTAVHNNAIYRFSSAANRDLFSANPSKYAPQFGGFCAYGAALGKKFEIDGKAFEVVDGKLYVNKNLDVYEVWVEDKSENIVEGDKQWTIIENVAAADL
jgi:hypothetical protein